MDRHRIRLGSVFAIGSVAALGALAGLAGLVGLGACTSAEGYVVVTVDARPAVHDARSITVTLSNAGTTRMDSLALHAPTFPVTFSISAPGRAGDLAIAVDATDDAGVVLGHGTTTTAVGAATAQVMLDSADFVVNTDYAGDQFPSSDFEAGGFQVAALPDGTWTTVFADGCPSGSCSLFARRFDRTGKPVMTQAAAGTNAFAVTARPTTSVATPAIASSQTATIAVWNFSDVGTATASGVACRALDAAGRLGTDQTKLDAVGAFVVSVAPLPGDSFVATWRILNASVDELHMAVVGPDCSAPGGVQLVARGAQVADFLHRGGVASSADHVMFAWSTNGDLHARMASSAGAFTMTVDTRLVAQTSTDDIESVRLAAAPGGGFVVGLRWADKAAGGNGRIELRQVSPAGVLLGTPALVTDRAGSDFDARHSFAMASRADGSVLVAWHACGTLGDDSQCGVFGRILRATGEPVTDAFAIPTTTLGDQQLPSLAALPDGFVAVWSDASMKPPDVAGKSVRARIVYPPQP